MAQMPKAYLAADWKALAVLEWPPWQRLVRVNRDLTRAAKRKTRLSWQSCNQSDPDLKPARARRRRLNQE